MPSYVQKALKQTAMAPSREGRVHIGAYLPADYKRGVRMLQAATGENFQAILARLLNEEFRRAQSAGGWSGLNQIAGPGVDQD